MASEMAANMKHIHAAELAETLVVTHPADAEGMLDRLRQEAEFYPDDEPVEERNRRLREKEAAFLASLGTQFKDRRR